MGGGVDEFGECVAAPPPSLRHSRRRRRRQSQNAKKPLFRRSERENRPTTRSWAVLTTSWAVFAWTSRTSLRSWMAQGGRVRHTRDENLPRIFFLAKKPENIIATIEGMKRMRAWYPPLPIIKHGRDERKRRPWYRLSHLEGLRGKGGGVLIRVDRGASHHSLLSVVVDARVRGSQSSDATRVSTGGGGNTGSARCVHEGGGHESGHVVSVLRFVKLLELETEFSPCLSCGEKWQSGG